MVETVLLSAVYSKCIAGFFYYFKSLQRKQILQLINYDLILIPKKVKFFKVGRSGPGSRVNKKLLCYLKECKLNKVFSIAKKYLQS